MTNTTLMRKLSQCPKNTQTCIIKQIASIEKSIQPYDYWNTHLIYEHIGLTINDALVMGITSSCGQSFKVVGYCLYQQIFETIEIFRIGTHQNFQRQGFAISMIEVLIEQHNKALENTLLLEVAENNDAAVSLYKQCGFRIIHIRKNYYKLGDGTAIDAFIMQHST